MKEGTPEPEPSRPRNAALDGTALFEQIFDAAPFAILIADDEGRYLEANPLACRLFGRSRDQLLGRRVYDFVDPEDLVSTQVRWADFRQRKVQAGEFPLLRADGTRKVLRYHAVADLAPGVHVSYLEDVTEIHAATAGRRVAEAQRDGLFGISSDVLFLVDAAGKLRRVSHAFGAVLGWSEDQVLGRDQVELVHPDDVAALNAAGAELDASGSAAARPLRFRHRDGSYRWLSWSSAVFGGETYCLARDVTAETEARRLLEQSEGRFRALADGVPLVIWIGDAAGRAQYYNRRWFEYTGLPTLPEGSPDLDHWNDVIHPEDLRRVSGFVDEQRQRGEPIELTFRLRRHDGAYRWHLARSIPLRDGAGQVVRRLGTATDIEDQRRAIEDLRLERDLRERFVAAVSHDLRSPLAAITMAASLLARRPSSADATGPAARILRNARHADALIQNLLDASRISAGQPLAVQRVPCDIAALVREVIADQTTVHGDRFSLDVAGEVRGQVDPSAVRRILENLIGNAVKHGAPDAPVRVSVTTPDGFIRLAVHNQGPPIPGDEQPRIFQPYHRVRPGGPGATVGWGLGLTLVRGAAEAHGGGVGLESSAEDGTTFTVTLRHD
jgi:PAS domain S-box-containing protein